MHKVTIWWWPYLWRLQVNNSLYRS